MEHCPLFDCAEAEQSATRCICDYILTERLNKIDSPKKVLRFNYGASPQGTRCGANGGEDVRESTSCLPDSVGSILRSEHLGHCHSTKTGQDGTSKVVVNGGVTIPSAPIRTVDLRQLHDGRKQLANDYYYHLMDFKKNKKLGCIAMRDSLHIIRGHFGDADEAEDNHPIRALNKQQRVKRSEYHFCSVKMSPNTNSTNPHVLCLGDNVGRLLFYDYVRGKYVHSIYKRNHCRISVVDWRNHFNSRNGIVAAGSLDKAVRVYDDRTYAQCHKLKWHKGEVGDWCFCECTDLLIGSKCTHCFVDWLVL